MSVDQIKERVFRYTVGDQAWELDWWDLEVTEVGDLRRVTGYRYPELVIEHESGDFDVIRAIVWICRRRAGEPNLAFDDVRFKIRDFRRELVRQVPDPQPPTAPETAPKPRPRRRQT